VSVLPLTARKRSSVSLSLACASRTPECTTETPATIGVLTPPGCQGLPLTLSKNRETFTPFTQHNVLRCCNHLDVLVKEHAPELVLPGGSVCSARIVYLVKCNLCKGMCFAGGIGVPPMRNCPGGQPFFPHPLSAGKRSSRSTQKGIAWSRYFLS